MNSKIPQNVLIDSGFWFALFDKSDQYHDEAIDIFYLINDAHILIPWPSLYETLNTRFIKNKNGYSAFYKLLNKSNVMKIDDTPYKNEALLEMHTFCSYRKRYINLVDMILRFILLDSSIKINFLVTFNARDFFDVCHKRSIEILNSP